MMPRSQERAIHTFKKTNSKWHSAFMKMVLERETETKKSDTPVPRYQMYPTYLCVILCAVFVIVTVCAHVSGLHVAMCGSV